MAWTSAAAVGLLGLALACAGSTGPATSVAPASAPSVAAVRQVLEVDGDPNGLWWDDAAQKLYIADDNGSRILAWSDAAGFSTWRELPSASPRAGLGQPVFTADGTLVVTRFGHGAGGQVLVVPASGEPQIVVGLDPQRRRIGLTVASDGRLFDGWFVKTDEGRSGGVSELSLGGQAGGKEGGKETDVLSGLKKPIGVLVSGDRLYVSDQDAGQILWASLTALGTSQVLATVPGADLLAQGPDGSIFAGSNSGQVFQISRAGEAHVVESGFHQVRGVAYDPTQRRLFIADHDGDEKNGVHHLLHVLPVPLP